jgi:hypothetical protein
MAFRLLSVEEGPSANRVSAGAMNDEAAIIYSDRDRTKWSSD